jgi:hypothetical protein
LNEIAPYISRLFPRLPQNIGFLGPLADQTAGIKLAVSVPVGGNRRPDDETPGLKSSSDENLASRGISAQMHLENLDQAEFLYHRLPHLALPCLARRSDREGIDETPVARNLLMGNLPLANPADILLDRLATGFLTIHAQSSSPYFLSGTPKTWTSATAG